MISVEEAREKILANVKVLEAETRPILTALGQALAEDVVSDMDIPPLDNSAMDGYAVRADDTKGAGRKSPKILKVIDTVAAGSISQKRIIPGTAIRIMTGAPLPEGAEAVVKFEDTDEQERGGNMSEIGILSGAPKGKNVRCGGGDIKKGTTVMVRGTTLRPAHIGVLASLGRPEVKVYRRPKVAVLATGNELEQIGRPLTPGKLYNSNSYSIAAGVIKYGGVPDVLGIALDREDSLTEMVRRGLSADMLITTGGVSMGDYDLVKDVLVKEGKISFWEVRLKPGKPIAFGTFPGKSGDIPHLGLPGNPVSAMVTFEIFAGPCILKMLGKKNFEKATVEATLEDTVENEDSRRVYARAVLEKRNGQYFARTTGPQGSGILTSMSQANALVVVPESIPLAKAGDKVQAILLDCGEEI
jgi:molybdopterin molybdotransferase